MGEGGDEHDHGVGGEYLVLFFDQLGQVCVNESEELHTILLISSQLDKNCPNPTFLKLHVLAVLQAN